jgi:hypothetical protein
MGATESMWSDRHAGTIVAVRRNKAGMITEVDWQADKATRTDSYGMSDAQSYSYERDLDAPVRTWKADRTGRFREMVRANPWSETDTRMRMASPSGGSRLILGIRDEHYDYSF